MLNPLVFDHLFSVGGGPDLEKKRKKGEGGGETTHKTPVKKMADIPIFFGLLSCNFQITCCGTIKIDISDALFKNAAPTLIALISKHLPPLIHGFQNLSIGLQEKIRRKMETA